MGVSNMTEDKKNLGSNPLITNIKIPEGCRTEKATFTFKLKGLNIIEECKEKIPLQELKILKEVTVTSDRGRERGALPKNLHTQRSRPALSDLGET
jgi:hypothetical protein